MVDSRRGAMTADKPGDDTMILCEDGEGSVDDENDGANKDSIMTPPASSRARMIAGVRHRSPSPSRRPLVKPKNNGRHDGRQLVHWHSELIPAP